MNIHLAHIVSFPFHSNTAHSGTARGATRRQDATELLGVDAKRPVKTRALGRYVGRFLTYLAQMPRRITERDELARCTDRELADMGITRGDIGRIHDPRFATDFAANRAASDSLKWL
ncbi:MAG: DUF1127 domain-containing protein [Acetobacteraceae bacterium]|nr:DUF1127 domain-containing protein [Acetobacteraceae bacterium]MSP30036.1 DUF1127 domain-containing protein [Acetobacteraceae bacterium]